MISVQLPKIRPDATLDLTEAIEAFSLCLLASYNGEMPTDRPVTSYKRAWGMDAITFYPRVVGGRPAFLVAEYLDPQLPRAVVAFEGASSWASYASYLINSGATTVTGCAGRAFAPFASYAAAANTILAGVWPFNLSPVIRQAVQVTFAGFSAGAGVAEILANQWANQGAARVWKMFTFAKPRVGNYRWLANRNPTLRGLNLICGFDPIASIPRSAITTLGSVVSSVPSFQTAFYRDNWAQRYSRGGEQWPAYGEWQDLSEMGALRRVYQTLDTNNPWYDHQMSSYRLMLQNWCSALNPQTGYRFRHLELPDNNRFGTNYDGQRAWDESLTGINIPDPPDAPPPGVWLAVGDILRELGAQVTLQPEAADEVWHEAPDRTNEWGVETTTQTTLRRRRR